MTASEAIAFEAIFTRYYHLVYQLAYRCVGQADEAEDIAQTCRNLAMMKHGQIIFQGTISDMLAEARGKVWLITTQGEKPAGNFTIVSTLPSGLGMQYWVVGELSARAGAALTEPTLEDAYVWLMRKTEHVSEAPVQ